MSGVSYGPIVDATATRLVGMFALRACRFEAFPFDVQLPRIEPGRIVLPAAEPGIVGWSRDRGVELPVRGVGLTVGRFVLVAESPTTGADFPPARRAAAIALVAPVGEYIVARLRGTAPVTTAP